MKIIDAFCFFNELTVLDLRLNILNEYVDEFILVESTHSHQNKPKPLFYEDNKHLFSKFNHKIRHVIVDTFPEHTYWSYEASQRNCIADCLQDLSDTDIVFISDLDEIWDPKKIIPILNNTDKDTIYRWQSKVCYFYFNLIAQPQLWIQPMFAQYCLFKRLRDSGYTLTEDILRGTDSGIKPQPANVIIPDLAGWHFSYIEDPIYKLQNFLHSEYNNMTQERLEECISKKINPFHTYNNMQVLPVEDLENFLPEYVWENIETYKSRIIYN